MPLPKSDWEIAANLFDTYPGGEDAFWLDWGLGRLGPEMMDWFRRHASGLAVDVEVGEAEARLSAREARRQLFDTPELQRRERIVREALAFGVEAPGTPTLDHADPLKWFELRSRFRNALFDLLEKDLEIDPSSWSGVSEAARGTAVLRMVFPELVPEAMGDAPPGFTEISEELRKLRNTSGQVATGDPVEQALRQIAGPLLQRSVDGATYQMEPSFRNYLRARLREACRELGWQPRPINAGGRFADLDAAFEALTRRRVVKVFQDVGDPEIGRWLAVDSYARNS